MTYTTRRRFLAGAGAVGLTSLLAACGQSSGAGNAAGVDPSANGHSYGGPDVTLNFWNGWTGGDGPHFLKIVDAFNKKTPNIEVKTTSLDWANLFAKLPNAIKAGKGPDVVAMHISDIPTQVAEQTIIPLDAVSKGLGWSADDFTPAVWNGGMYNGKRYGIPLDIIQQAFFYNKKVMAGAGLDPSKPPLQSNEYMAALDALKKAGVQGQWMGADGMVTTDFDTLLHQFGGIKYNDAGDKATWNSDAGVQALTWLVDLQKKGYSPAHVGVDADWNSFKADKSAFMWGGIWYATDPDLSKVDWGMATMPVLGKNGAVWGDSHQFTITSQIADDKNKQEAAAYFINQVSSNSLEWARSVAVPARSSVRESPAFKKLKPQSALLPQTDEVFMPQSFPGHGDADNLLNKAINQAMLGKQDAGAALNSAADRANKILVDNKKKYQY